MTNTPIKILNGSLDEQSDGEIVLRGLLDMASLDHLRTDDYQREVLVGHGKNSDLMVKAVEEKIHFNDIELGMRGQRFDSDKDGNYVLYNPVYIIDGLQRTSAIRAWRDRNPDKKIPVSLGVKVHFATDYKEEKRLFVLWNGPARRRVSPNIMLRNERDAHPGLLAIYTLSTTEQKFPLCGKVTWSQNALRTDLVTAMNVVRSAVTLTRRYSSAAKSSRRAGVSSVGARTRQSLPVALDNAVKEMGLPKFRQSVSRFFEIVDDSWGIRTVVYANKSTHLKGNFLTALAQIFSDHDLFWKDGTLVVGADIKARLKSFPTNDPEVYRLAGAGDMAVELLYNLMVKHLNARRPERNRLVKSKKAT